MSDANALLALKNAWNSVVIASDRVRELAPSIAALPEQTPLGDVDFETYHNVVLAHANAVMALRALVEQLRTGAQPVTS